MIWSPQSVNILVPRRADRPEAFRRIFRRLGGSISPDAVDSIAAAIQTHEGWYPGSVSYRNNNPGNLVYAGQPGASPGAGGFAHFDTYELGLAALKNQIVLDASRGSDAAGRPINNISDLIGSWAPASDPRNDTPAYVAAVSSQTGYNPFEPLSSLSAPGGYDLAASPFSAGKNVLMNLPGPVVDLSSVGLPSDVPALLLGGAAVAALLLFR